MKRNYVVMGFVVIAASALAIATPTVFLKKRTIIPNDELSLVVEPDDGITPVLAMIDGAKKSLDIVMYELDDAQIEAALAADEARGVAVRVILSGGYEGAPPTVYTAAYDFLV